MPTWTNVYWTSILCFDRCSDVGGSTTQILDRLDTPPPMPLSCRPKSGSGDPIIPKNIGIQSDLDEGRCACLRKMPLDVPPRRKLAGMGFGWWRVEDELSLASVGDFEYFEIWIGHVYGLPLSSVLENMTSSAQNGWDVGFRNQNMHVYRKINIST